MASKPCRWWNDSSLHTRVIARAYGPYEHRVSGTWFMIAAPSTSQPIAATSAQRGRRVVEDRRVLLPAGVQQVEQLVAVGAERLGGAVEVEPVPGLVLHLGDEDALAAQRRRAGDPVALGLHADDLGVRVLGDLAHQRLAVALRHPVARLDPAVGVDPRLELLLERRLTRRGLLHVDRTIVRVHRPARDGPVSSRPRSAGHYGRGRDRAARPAATAARAPYSLEELLEVVAREFLERGYDATSMEDLSRATGRTKSSIYHHVSGKEELLRLAVARAVDALFAVLDEDGRAAGPRGRRGSSTWSAARRGCSPPSCRTSRCCCACAATPTTERWALGRRRDFDRRLAELVRDAVEEGDLRADLDPRAGHPAAVRDGEQPGRLVPARAAAHGRQQVEDALVALAFDGLRPPTLGQRAGRRTRCALPSERCSVSGLDDVAGDADADVLLDQRAQPRRRAAPARRPRTSGRASTRTVISSSRCGRLSTSW